MTELAVLVESLLFVAPEAVKITTLADALQESPERIEETLGELIASQNSRGVRVQRLGERIQMVTAPEAATAIERFLGLDLTTRLSPAALETLAIIAYKQPITRAQIDELRGVASDGVLRTLIHRNLVEQGERLEQAGRPFQFRTTFDFLQHFGLQSLEDLPSLDESTDSAPVFHTGAPGAPTHWESRPKGVAVGPLSDEPAFTTDAEQQMTIDVLSPTRAPQS